MAEQYRFIQALRGIAASLVVLFHAAEGDHIPALLAAMPAVLASGLFGYGWIGVPIFFALSGFVIAHSIRGATVDRRYVGRFIARRTIRLDPPFWISIAIVVLIDFVSAGVKGEAFVPPAAGHVLAHMTYTQVILDIPAINVIYWTLTYEVQFYLVLVLAMMAFQQLRGAIGARRAGALVFGMLLAIAIGWGTELIATPYDHGLFVQFWASFYSGALAYWARERRIALAALLILAATILPFGSEPLRFSIATALMLLAVAKAGLLVNGLGWRWLQGLGAISYSLYLTHAPVQGTAFYLAKRFVPAGAAGEFVHLILACGACIAVAAVLWWTVERPSQWLARRYARPRRAPPVPNTAAQTGATA